MVRRLTKSLFLAVVVLSGVALMSLLYSQKYASRFFGGSGRTVMAGASCVEPSSQQASPENPNKTLFVTCDGYLE